MVTNSNWYIEKNPEVKEFIAETEGAKSKWGRLVVISTMDSQETGIAYKNLTAPIINRETGEVYIDCTKKKIYAKLAVHFLIRPFFVLFKTAYHLCFPISIPHIIYTTVIDAKNTKLKLEKENTELINEQNELKSCQKDLEGQKGKIIPRNKYEQLQENIKNQEEIVKKKEKLVQKLETQVKSGKEIAKICVIKSLVSLADIISTPLHGVAMLVVNIAALIIIPFAPKSTFYFMEAVGKLIKSMHHTKNTVKTDIFACFQPITSVEKIKNNYGNSDLKFGLNEFSNEQITFYQEISQKPINIKYCFVPSAGKDKSFISPLCEDIKVVPKGSKMLESLTSQKT